MPAPWCTTEPSTPPWTVLACAHCGFRAQKRGDPAALLRLFALEHAGCTEPGCDPPSHLAPTPAATRASSAPPAELPLGPPAPRRRKRDVIDDGDGDAGEALASAVVSEATLTVLETLVHAVRELPAGVTALEDRIRLLRGVLRMHHEVDGARVTLPRFIPAEGLGLHFPVLDVAARARRLRELPEFAHSLAGRVISYNFARVPEGLGASRPGTARALSKDARGLLRVRPLPWFRVDVSLLYWLATDELGRDRALHWLLSHCSVSGTELDDEREPVTLVPDIVDWCLTARRYPLTESALLFIREAIAGHGDELRALGILPVVAPAAKPVVVEAQAEPAPERRRQRRRAAEPEEQAHEQEPPPESPPELDYGTDAVDEDHSV